jgi:DNA polymerase-3 subunit epsilon
VGVQLRLDAADRLVELVEERRGPVHVDEAARHLFKLASAPAALARSLLDDVVADDARLAWSGDAVWLTAPAGSDLPLEEATYVVVDLETTGLRPARAAIVEIGAVRVRGFEELETFETFVNPRAPLPPAITALTGIANRDVRRAPPVTTALRRFLAFAGDAVLVAHNAAFDLAFLDRETERLTGRRLAAPVVDTLGLARRLLAGRAPRASLAALSFFVGTSVRPCHRALPDARATGEVLLHLIGLAQERGARTVADLCELAATRPRRLYSKRTLAYGAPTRPGVYLFYSSGAGLQSGTGVHAEGRMDTVLYVGRARDLRARLRSYFRSERQRPAVEAALGAVERIEWRVCGSELEAALEELRLIRELRPAANARASRPNRYVYLRRRGETVVVSSRPGPLGPIRSRRRAQLAARALRPEELDRLAAGEAAARLRARIRDLSDTRRFEDAGRARDRLAAVEAVTRGVRRLERLRAARMCLLVPALEAGFVRAHFLAGGRIASIRPLPAGGGALLEAQAGLAAAATAGAAPSVEPEDADALLLLDSFLRRPPPELVVTPLELTAIVAGAERCRRRSGRTVTNDP